jgi:hypothetical protein
MKPLYEKLIDAVINLGLISLFLLAVYVGMSLLQALSAQAAVLS